MKFKFEGLIIWQNAMIIGEKVNEITDGFPKKERYNLSLQMCRAADSIALNISEGSIVQSKKEFQKFMGYAIRSLAEVVTCLHKARNRNYIDHQRFENQYVRAYKLMNMMIAFRKKI